MSMFKFCFLLCSVIWKLTRIIWLALLPTFFEREVWTLERVFEDSLQWNPTFRPLKPGGQSKVLGPTRCKAGHGSQSEPIFATFLK